MSMDSAHSAIIDITAQVLGKRVGQRSRLQTYYVRFKNCSVMLTGDLAISHYFDKGMIWIETRERYARVFVR